MAITPQNASSTGSNRAASTASGWVSGSSSSRATGPGSLFGVPVGDLGWFASLLMGTATGFAAFFAATFCGIVGILFYNTTTHKNIDFSYSYARIGLPFGILVLVIALCYLGTLWIRRITRKA